MKRITLLIALLVCSVALCAQNFQAGISVGIDNYFQLTPNEKIDRGVIANEGWKDYYGNDLRYGAYIAYELPIENRIDFRVTLDYMRVEFADSQYPFVPTNQTNYSSTVTMTTPWTINNSSVVELSIAPAIGIGWNTLVEGPVVTGSIVPLAEIVLSSWTVRLSLPATYNLSNMTNVYDERPLLNTRAFYVSGNIGIEYCF